MALNGGFANTGDAAGDTFLAVENITGSAFDDILRGSTDANVLIGGAGNDRLEGLDGADTMTGGAGNDTFFFDRPTDGGATGDVITDFGSGAGNDDRFELRGSNFDGLAAGALTAAQFQSSTADTAGTADVRFFFETDTGKLFYDRDGSGATHAAVLLATLQPGATVELGDFTII